MRLLNHPKAKIPRAIVPPVSFIVPQGDDPMAAKKIISRSIIEQTFFAQQNMSISYGRMLGFYQGDGRDDAWHFVPPISYPQN